MKKILSLVILGGLLAASTLQAQVQIYINGSSAFRANAYRVITNLYGNGLTYQNPGGAGANNSGASVVTLQGTMDALYPGQTVTVFCNYNGSVQGVHALTANDTLLYLTNDLSNFNNTNTISHTADIAFSDVDQLSTTFTSPALVSTNVGVLPFCWVRSINCPTTVSNITMQQIQQLWGTGFIPASYFTGNTNDTTSIFMTGRNKDSGTRLTAALDAFASGVPSIYQVSGGIWVKMTANQIINGVNYGPGFTSGWQRSHGSHHVCQQRRRDWLSWSFRC
ncbi:MAG: hypothetical protein WDM76_14795 [Limisphaerales bacterium]